MQSVNAPKIRCNELARRRRLLNIRRSRLSVACFLASLSDELGEELTRRLVKIALEDEVGKCVDYNNLARFEAGSQKPWKSVIKSLCYVFTLASGEEVTASDLFPELSDQDLISSLPPNDAV